MGLFKKGCLCYNTIKLWGESPMKKECVVKNETLNKEWD